MDTLICKTNLPPPVPCGFKAVTQSTGPHPDFPSLSRLQFHPVLKEIGLQIFLSRSSLATLALEIPSETRSLEAFSRYILHSLIDTIVYVDFPNALPARVVAISTRSSTIPRSFTPSISPDTLRSDLSVYFLNKGMLLGECEFLLHVEPLDYIAKLPDGKYEYVWKDRVVEYPLEAARRERDSGSHLDLPRKREEKEEFRVGERVISVQQSSFGVSGVVMGHKDGTVQIGEQVIPHAPPTPVGRQDHQRFYTARDLSRSLSVSPKTVERFVGNFKIKYSCEGTVSVFDFGLNLTSDYEEYLLLEGWSHWNSERNYYEYSTDILEELKLYKQQFPRLWNRVEELHGAKITRAELIFPDISEPIDELRRISLFVSGLQSSQLQWTPFGSTRATTGQIGHIREYISHYRPSITSSVAAINPAALISSQPALIRPAFSGKFHFSIGDLVINISDKEIPYVGFGKIGVVIGVYSHNYVEIMVKSEYGRQGEVVKVVRSETLVNVNEGYMVPLRKKEGGKVGGKVEGKVEGKKNWAAKMVQKPKPIDESPASLNHLLSAIPALSLNPSATEFTPNKAPEAPDSFSLPPPSI